MRQFCYIEFEKLQAQGHHLNMIGGITRTLRDSCTFEQFSFIGQFDASSETRRRLQRDGFDRVLAELPRLNRPNEINNVGVVSDQLLACMEAVISDSTSTVFYIAMPSPYGLLAACFAARRIPLDRDIKILVRLAMTDEEWAWYENRISSLINYSLVSPSMRQRLCFTVESRRLQAYYSSRTCIPLPIQFGPVSDFLVSMTRRKWRHFIPGRSCLNLAFIGEAREEKGFQFLPKFVDIFSNLLYNSNFYIQCNSSTENDTPLVSSARSELYKLRNDSLSGRLHLYDAPLPCSLYESILTKADCLLLPYMRDRYACRGSGVALEGIQADAIIIVTSGTDLEATFAMCDGAICFDFDSEDVVAKAPDLVRGIFERGARKRRASHADLEACSEFAFGDAFLNPQTVADLPRLDLNASSHSEETIRAREKELRALEAVTRMSVNEELPALMSLTKQSFL